MFKNILQNNSNFPIKSKSASFVLHKVSNYLCPLEIKLDKQLDKRLVRTFFDLFVVILLYRNRAMGLLLSELGAFICGFDQAPAGTKRISNLLLSKKWEASAIDDFFFQRTKQRIEELKNAGKRALMLWDDSRVEKHESWVAEGLCSVRSSKAKRLTRVRPGFFRPPASNICVPGFEWTGVFLSYLGGVPSICRMSWWTTRGKFKEDPDNIIYRLLRNIHQDLGRLVHVLDRGFANEKMLRYLFNFQQDFIIRWKKTHLLDHSQKGRKKTHLLARSFMGRSSKVVKDKERKKTKSITIDWTPVTHPEYPDNQLYIIIVRDKKNYKSPMYIITSLCIQNATQAWEVFFSYMHRWEAEKGFRFLKSEMALESPRLWFWHNRMKLMAIASLVYDFLLSIFRNWRAWIQLFFRRWCHRTGKRYRQTAIPLYRLRMAISNCLFSFWAQNSG